MKTKKGKYLRPNHPTNEILGKKYSIKRSHQRKPGKKIRNRTISPAKNFATQRSRQHNTPRANVSPPVGTYTGDGREAGMWPPPKGMEGSPEKDGGLSGWGEASGDIITESTNGGYRTRERERERDRVMQTKPSELSSHTQTPDSKQQLIHSHLMHCVAAMREKRRKRKQCRHGSPESFRHRPGRRRDFQDTGSSNRDTEKLDT